MLKRVLDRSEMSLAGLGFDLAASVAVGTALGWWIDHRFGTDPWGIVVCGLVGIVGGLVNFVRTGQAMVRRQAEDGGDTVARRAGEDTDEAPGGD